MDGFSFGPQTNDVSLGRYPGRRRACRSTRWPSPLRAGRTRLAGANRPPVFEPVPDQNVAEGSLLALHGQGPADPDAGQTVRYSLGADAPAEATIDEAHRPVPLDAE